MNRTAWLAVLLFAILATGAGFQWWYAHVPKAPQDGVQAVGPLTASAKWTLGQKVKLNAVAEAELAGLPGIGPSLAKKLIAAREGSGFKSWEDVDAVAGVGPAKLKELQSMLEL